MKQYLTTSEAAEFLSIKPRALVEWRYRGEGPPFHRFGRLVRYTPEGLQDWADSQLVEAAAG